jgi:hypothetical protein
MMPTRSSGARGVFLALGASLALAGCFEGLGNAPGVGAGGAPAGDAGGTATTGLGGAGGAGGAETGGAETGGAPPCTPGQLRSCYTGAPGTLDVGACKAGKQVCDAAGAYSGPCNGEVTPQPETCLTPGDDDCNGLANEGGAGCVCAPGAVVPCYTGPAGTAGVGICKAGTAVCDVTGTATGPCLGDVTPQPENCFNGVDDDCDGETNGGCACTPGDVVSCYTGPAGTLGVGLCAAGTRTCDAGAAYGPCLGDVKPQPETCLDLVDNDCNGQVNEGGAGCVCVPGTTSACYTGPAGTLGVGPCAAGTKACNGLGTAWGACAGQTLPTPEDCATPVDENCDGATPTCGGGPVWARVWGSAADEEGATVAVDASDNVYLGGYMNGTLDFGCGPLTSQTDGALLVKFSPSGTCLWSRVFGTSTGFASLATDAAGNVYGTGAYSGALDFGGGALPLPSGGADVFLVKLDAGGNHLWSRPFGGSGAQTAAQVSVDGSGDVVTSGYFQGSINCGGATLVSAGGTDVYVAKLSAAGAHLWSKRYGDAGNQITRGSAVDPAGNVLITGNYTGTLDFGGGPLPSAGLNDVFVVKLSPAGVHRWSRRYGDASDQIAGGVATDAAGNVIVAGYFWGSMDFGSGVIPAIDHADVFLAKLDPLGAPLWAHVHGGYANQGCTGVAIGPQGTISITGVLQGTIDFGGGPLTNVGGGDMFVANFDASGAHVWSRRYGDPAAQSGKAVAIDSTGATCLTGLMQGPADFGNGPLLTFGGEDIFLAKLGP